jgi:hypothetical protein
MDTKDNNGRSSLPPVYEIVRRSRAGYKAPKREKSRVEREEHGTDKMPRVSSGVRRFVVATLVAVVALSGGIYTAYRLFNRSASPIAAPAATTPATPNFTPQEVMSPPPPPAPKLPIVFGGQASTDSEKHAVFVIENPKCDELEALPDQLCNKGRVMVALSNQAVRNCVSAINKLRSQSFELALRGDEGVDLTKLAKPAADVIAEQFTASANELEKRIGYRPIYILIDDKRISFEQRDAAHDAGFVRLVTVPPNKIADGRIVLGWTRASKTVAHTAIVPLLEQQVGKIQIIPIAQMAPQLPKPAPPANPTTCTLAATTDQDAGATPATPATPPTASTPAPAATPERVDPFARAKEPTAPTQPAEPAPSGKLANGSKCKLDSDCLSGFCNFYQGYTCQNQQAASAAQPTPAPQATPAPTPPAPDPTGSVKCEYTSQCAQGRYCSPVSHTCVIQGGQQ